MHWVWWIAIGLAACIVLVAAVFFAIALYIHRKIFYRRYNGNKFIRYFTADDFEGIHADPVAFASDKGQLLHGFIYRSEGVKPIGAAVFSHGFGAGHQAYTTEIAALARAGLLVLA